MKKLLFLSAFAVMALVACKNAPEAVATEEGEGMEVVSEACDHNHDGVTCEMANACCKNGECECTKDGGKCECNCAEGKCCKACGQCCCLKNGECKCIKDGGKCECKCAEGKCCCDKKCAEKCCKEGAKCEKDGKCCKKEGKCCKKGEGK